MSKRMREWLATIAPEAREHVIKTHTGTNLAYILKRTYCTPIDELPTFKIRIAVGLDKASKGKLDFREMVAGAPDIDWQYVRREIDRRKPIGSDLPVSTTEQDQSSIPAVAGE